MLETYEVPDKGWRWKLVADNNEPLAEPEEGQYFASEAACLKSFDTVVRYAVKSGRVETTEQQMQSAGKKSLFIWRELDLTFPKLVAQHLGRLDIDIQPVDWLDRRQNWSEVSYPEVIVDHGANLTTSQNRSLKAIKSS